MKALTYDDIQLVPEYSCIESRQNIRLDSIITINYSLKLPIIAAPMPTVCGGDMALTLSKLGAIGCIHRFMSIKDQADIVSRLYSLDKNYPIMAAVGTNGDYLERTQALHKVGVSIILIDVAHGHHENVKNAITEIKKISDCDIIAGNIATVQAAKDLQDWGADALRVGIGGGSLCTTRIKTGFGIPNVTCIEQIAKAVRIPIIADGGIRTTGDMAKALAVGASSIMIGSMIAGTDESPGMIINKPDGLYKKYAGAASFETKLTHGQALRNIEGESTIIPYKGRVETIIDEIKDGLRSALSYAGAVTVGGFKPKYVEVTQAGLNEARPHLL
jgi:IMP dehydrogenase